MSARGIFIEIMEQFGDSEPIDLVIVYTNAAKRVHVQSSCPAVTALGMVEFARVAMLKTMNPEVQE